MPTTIYKVSWRTNQTVMGPLNQTNTINLEQTSLKLFSSQSDANTYATTITNAFNVICPSTDGYSPLAIKVEALTVI